MYQISKGNRVNTVVERHIAQLSTRELCLFDTMQRVDALRRPHIDLLELLYLTYLGEPDLTQDEKERFLLLLQEIREFKDSDPSGSMNNW